MFLKNLFYLIVLLKENIILNNKKFSKNEEHKFYNLMTDLDLPPKLFESTKSIGENGCMLSGAKSNAFL